MSLPANVSTGLVTGRFLVGVTDGPDQDQDPDGIAATGTVTFTAAVPYLADPTASTVILNTKVVGVLDVEGYLCTPVQGTLDPAYRGVRLIATDDPDVSVTGWTWNVSYQFGKVNKETLTIPGHGLAVLSNGTVDLSTAVTVPSSPGLGTEQAEALTASAQAAAVTSANEAAAAAVSASNAAAAAQATDANVAGLVTGPGQTRDAVDSITAAAVAPKLNSDDAASTYQSITGLPASVAAQVSTPGTSTNTAVKAIADSAAAPKLDAAEKGAASGVAPLDTGSRVPEANLPAGLAATALEAKYASLAELNAPTYRFDQFPISLTDSVSINGAPIYRQVGDVIYAVFWGSDMNPYIAKMKHGEYAWKTVNLGTIPGNPLSAPAPHDEHNQLNMVIDGAGYIHVSGNHHRVPLNYIRSTVPNSITTWEAPGMVGTDETEVTYPEFERLNDGNLLFFYRSGTSSDGDLMLNKYSTTTRTWARVNMVLKGHDWLTTADDVSAYVRTAYDSTPNRLHLWWVWRDTIDISSNFDLCYMYTVDGGVTWQNAAGTTQTLPVTPANTAVQVFAGGSGHTVTGATFDGNGVAHAAVRMGDGEVRHYTRNGANFTYQVIGQGIGNTDIVNAPNGKMYAFYNAADAPYVKQVLPTIGTAVKFYPWAVPNWTPRMVALTGSYTARVLVAPSNKTLSGNYGGVLTLDLTDAAIAKLTAGQAALPKPQSRAPIPVPVNHIPGSYGMMPGMYYGPSGARVNTPTNIANGVFKGGIITAARAGKIVECAVNCVTAGSTGSKIRFVLYRPDGKVVAQSADVDATITGTRSATINAWIGRNENYILGVIYHGASGVSPVFSGSPATHDSRIALGNATSYFTAVRGGFTLSGLAVPAVDQAVEFLSPATGASVPSADNIPIVVIKAGDIPAGWGTAPV